MRQRPLKSRPIVETPETPPAEEWDPPIEFDEYDEEELVFLPIKKWKKSGSIYLCIFPDCNKSRGSYPGAGQEKRATSTPRVEIPQFMQKIHSSLKSVHHHFS